MTKLFRSLVWTGFVAIGVAACGDDVTITPPPPPPPPPTPQITAVSVAPSGVSLQVGSTLTMVASVTAEAGIGAITYAWSSSDVTKATVAGTTANATVTGVAVGSVGIRATATAGTSTASGVATVNIVAAPTCVVSGVTVTPATAALVVGQTVQATAAVNGTAQCATTVTWTPLTPAVASVNATGLVTGVADGNAVIRATSTADATKSGTMAVTVRTPDPATVSIQSLTAGGLPINLSNVLGQIEVALNVDRGEKVLDRVDVLIGGQIVASQSFSQAAPAAAPSSAPVTVVLNVNTRQLAQVGALFVPVIFNGQTAVTSNLYVVGSSTPIASNAVPVLMNNPDAATQPTVLNRSTPSPSVVNGGFTWTAGGVDASWNYIAFSNRAPVSSLNALACGAQASVVSGTTTTGLTVANTWTCAGVQSSAVALGAVGATAWAAGTLGPDGSALRGPEIAVILPPNTVAVAGYSSVGSSFRVGHPTSGPMRWNLITPTPNPLPAAVAIDNVAPVFGALATVAFNTTFDQPWINASFAFGNYGSPTDAGSGIDAAATGTRSWLGTGPGTCTGGTVVTGADLAETLTSNATDGHRVCGFAADRLGNASTSGVSNYFGVDKVAPAVRFIGKGTPAPTPAPAGVPAFAFDSAANTVIYRLGYLTPAQVLGVEGLDTRSGFHQVGVVTPAGLYPAFMSLGATNVAGTFACPVASNALATILSDTYVRSIELGNTCGGAPTAAYYAWSGRVTDRAGNASATLSTNYAKDDVAAPAITGLGFASGFYTPGTAASFGISANDDLEVINGTLLVTQANAQGAVGLRYPFGTLNALGTRWDATITNVINGAPLNIPEFIFRVDGVCTAAGVPYASCPATVGVVNTVSAEYATGAAQLPTAMTANVNDVGFNPGGGIGPVAMLPTQFSPSTGIAEPWVAADLIQWNGSVSGANAVAAHMASTSIVVPFFDSVGLWRVNIAGELVFCGIKFPAPVLTDNGVNRFWTYTTAIPTAANGACTNPSVGPATFAAGTWRAVAFKGGAVLVSNAF